MTLRGVGHPGHPGRARGTAGIALATGLAILLIAPASAIDPEGSTQPSVSPAAPAAPSAASVVPSQGAGSLAWSRPETDGEGPVAREDHTLTVDPDAGVAWLYGGRTAGGRVLGDLWRLELATHRWQRIPRGDRAPSGRFGHGAVWVPDVGLVVWAGQASRGFLDDLWAFQPERGTWRRLTDPDQRRPRARYGSCMALGPDGRIWISHGFTDDLGRFDDTWAFDPATGRWHDETPDGPHPGARCLHECAWTPDGRLLLYGGQTTGVPALGDAWTLTIGKGWRRVAEAQPGTSAPVARSLPAMTVMGGAAWLFGGADIERAALADLWRLDLLSMTWQAVAVDGAGPRARSGAALVADPLRERLLLFGGRDDRRALADLRVLHAPATASPGP